MRKVRVQISRRFPHKDLALQETIPNLGVFSLHKPFHGAPRKCKIEFLTFVRSTR